MFEVKSPSVWVAGTVLIYASPFYAPRHPFLGLPPLGCDAMARGLTLTLFAVAAGTGSAASLSDRQDTSLAAQNALGAAQQELADVAPLQVATERNLYENASAHNNSHPHVSNSELMMHSPYCMSHNVYIAIGEAMYVAANTFRKHNHTYSKNGTSEDDEPTQSAILLIIGVAAAFLLACGSRFPSASLSLALMTVVFVVAFQVVDNITYDGESTFAHCVLPLVIAVLTAMFAALLGVFISKMDARIALGLLGFAWGFILTYILRYFILYAVPELDDDNHFAWFWVFLVLGGLSGAAAAVLLGHVLVIVSTITIGAWGLTTSIAGLIAVFSREPVGWAPFLAMLIAWSAIGYLIQLWLHRGKLAPRFSVDQDKVDLIGS